MISVLAAADPILSFGGAEGSGGVLNDVLATFTRLLNNGGQRIVEAEKDLCGALLFWQFLKLVLETGLSKRVAWGGIQSFLMGWTWYQLATNAVAVTAAFASWMGSLGSFLSDGTERGSDIMGNPSKFVVYGVRGFKNLYEQTDKFSILEAAPFIAFFLVLGFLVLICYTFLGLLVMWVVVKAKLDMLLGLALIPFVIEPQLKALAGVGVGLIVAAGIRLGATSLAIAASYSFLSQITLPPDPSTGQAIRLCLAVAGCCAISGGVAMLSKVMGGAIGAKRFFG